MYKGQKIPVLKADPKETISKRYEQAKNMLILSAFLAENVADPNTATWSKWI